MSKPSSIEMARRARRLSERAGETLRVYERAGPMLRQALRRPMVGDARLLLQEALKIVERIDGNDPRPATPGGQAAKAASV